MAKNLWLYLIGWYHLVGDCARVWYHLWKGDQVVIYKRKKNTPDKNEAENKKQSNVGTDILLSKHRTNKFSIAERN